MFSALHEMEVEDNEDRNSPTNFGDMVPDIQCCICGDPIQPNATNMCVNCLNDKVDVSEGVSRNVNIFRCRTCFRWLRNLKWFVADLESAELLGICLKKITGLNKVRLVDAVWVWTEPHSKRLKIRLTVEKEVFSNAIVQKKFIVDYIIRNQQCDECAASYTEHTWNAVVQARQKVVHKKTFFYLEQLILKHNIASHCLGIKYQPDGLDFFFLNRSQAAHFADFFKSTVPCKMKESKRLVTHDPKSNKYKYKHTYYVEICAICRYDLVILPAPVMKSLGGRYPVLLCEKVSTLLHLMDPNSLRSTSVESYEYFKKSFVSAATFKQAKTYYVLDVEPVKDDKNKPIQRGKHQLCELELILEEDLDAGLMENAVDCRSHLGHVLQVGDYCAAYHLPSLNLTMDLKHLRKLKVPDVVVVKKIYKQRRRRKWKLHTMAQDLEMNMRDREEFLQDLEDDPEYRANINVYKNDDLESMSEATMDDPAPQIPLAELLDAMTLEGRVQIPILDAEAEN